MYSESDIEAAIAAGAITPAAAEALRDSVARTRAAPAVDEESFRLLTGFNDIFVTIAAVLLLVAVGWIGASIGRNIVSPVPYRIGGDEPFMDPSNVQLSFGAATAVSGLLVAGASWALAEYFTRRRRMALPSIVLLASLTFAVASGLFGVGFMVTRATTANTQTMAVIGSAVGLLTAATAYLHWRRFHVPITIAALTGALVATVLALLLAAVPQAQSALLWLMLAAGIAVFAFAMWWDMSDRLRQTRRSDVAFWLHLSAAPLIAHPVFNLLGVLGGEPSAGRALSVLLLYAVFGVVALAVDRRALLVSSLVYVLIALTELFGQAGAVNLNFALTALVIGSALLMLSAFWHGARKLVVARLPADLQARLPALDRPVRSEMRPA